MKENRMARGARVPSGAGLLALFALVAVLLPCCLSNPGRAEFNFTRRFEYPAGEVFAWIREEIPGDRLGPGLYRITVRADADVSVWVQDGFLCVFGRNPFAGASETFEWLRPAGSPMTVQIGALASGESGRSVELAVERVADRPGLRPATDAEFLPFLEACRGGDAAALSSFIDGRTQLVHSGRGFLAAPGGADASLRPFVTTARTDILQFLRSMSERRAFDDPDADWTAGSDGARGLFAGGGYRISFLLVSRMGRVRLLGIQETEMIE